MRAELITPVPAAFAIAAGLPPRVPGYPRQLPPRRSPADRLREALLAMGDHRGEVLAHRQKAWASITFAGARHTVTLRFAGEEAVAAGERLVSELSEHEFALPGQIVADAGVVEAEHRLLPAPCLIVTCELLLVEEG